MTLPTAILSILPVDRVSFCTRSIQHLLAEAGRVEKLEMIESTLKVMADRGDVEWDGDGWLKVNKEVKPKQGRMF